MPGFGGERKRDVVAWLDLGVTENEMWLVVQIFGLRENGGVVRCLDLGVVENWIRG